jgi:hypothetical protein
MTSSSSPHQHATTLESRKQEIHDKLDELAEKLFNMSVLDTSQTEAIIRNTEYIRKNVDINKIIIDRKKESVDLNKELDAEILKQKKIEKDNSDLQNDYDSINTELKSDELNFTKLKNDFMNLSTRLQECSLENGRKKALIDKLKNEL